MSFDISEEDYFAHYGTPRKSGRYPWGSGQANSAIKSSTDFLGLVAHLKSQGLKGEALYKGLGLESSTELRAYTSIANNLKKQIDISTAQKLKDKQLSNIAIGKKMGINESSVRALLAPGAKDKADVLQGIADHLRKQVDENNYLDVGSGTEHHVGFGISETRLKTAVAILKAEGYNTINVQVDQLGTAYGKKTLVRTLVPPGVDYKEVNSHQERIKTISGYTPDGGRTLFGYLPPLSIDSSRVGINYKENGGAQADGVIYVRPGVKDVSLGKARYAQVRILVDGTHYIKGMAMYKDDLPKGHDLVFNTNKSDKGDKLLALKPVERTKDGNVDPDNAFGSMLKRQIGEVDAKGDLTHLTSAMNIVNEEGDWAKWSKSLSSQVLSKQSPVLARTLLAERYNQKKGELDEILALTNPAVRKKLLDAYADGADKAAVNLKAAALPGQASHAILPIASMKPNEIYAPNYPDGQVVALIRYPHGGKFEIPELVVNNKQPEAKGLLGNAADAVGISSHTASRLSGADFDGDTVLVIPNSGSSRLKTEPGLAKLADFDPQASYKGYEGMKKLTPQMKGKEMGDVSNLITDMTIRGATNDELARAVRHSMVVIDAEKHGLDYKQSALDHGIPALKEKYQSDPSKPNARGASTLISRAGSTERVADRKLRPASKGGPIDPKTGEKVYEYSGKTYVKMHVNKKTGEVTEETVLKPGPKSKKLAEFNANDLSSGTLVEKVYADHSNNLKDLANKARLATLDTKPIDYSPTAAKAYDQQVKELRAQLNLIQKNRPLERNAQVLANATVAMKRAANPNMEDSELKKVKASALIAARQRTGASKQEVEITPLHWQAIQAGAISNHMLTQILDKANLDVVKQLATPRFVPTITPALKSRAQAMVSAGKTQAEIASALGVALSTLKKSLEEGN